MRAVGGSNPMASYVCKEIGSLADSMPDGKLQTQITRCGEIVEVLKMLEAAGWHGHPSAAGGQSTMLSLWYPTASADPPASSHHTHGLLSNQIGEGRKRRLPLTEQPPFPLCHTLHFSIARSFGFINQGISGSSTRDTLNYCAVALSGSSFAMTSSR